MYSKVLKLNPAHSSVSREPFEEVLREVMMTLNGSFRLVWRANSYSL